MGKRAERTRRLPEFTTKAKIIFGLVAFAFLGALGVFIVTSLLSGQILGQSEATKIREELSNKDSGERKTEAVSSAYSAAQAGDDKKAATIYEQAIEVESDPAAKVQLAIDYARILNSQKKYDEAIEVSKKAEGYSDDKYVIANWLAVQYERAKKYDEAIQYYTLAGNTVDSPTNTTGYKKGYYDSKVASLRPLVK